MEQKSGSLPEKTPFETLIKGPYREDFQKKVEEILRKRFRQLEKSRREEAGRAGKAPRGAGEPDPREAARGAGEPDPGEGAALPEAGTAREEAQRETAEAPAPAEADVPAGREQAPPEDGKQALPEALTGEGPASSEAGGPAGAEARSDGRYAQILRSAREARRVYPQFRLRQELGSRRFAELLFRGVDAKTAYEAVHHEEMLRAAMGYGVRRASEKLARARMERPAENGSGSQSVAVSRRDPARLSPEEREDIRRRVLERGERVRF